MTSKSEVVKRAVPDWSKLQAAQILIDQVKVSFADTGDEDSDFLLLQASVLINEVLANMSS